MMVAPSRKIREFTRREDDILQAALALLDSDDWLTVTVEQIADAAGIGKGTVYKHFASKESIYVRLTLDFYYGLLEAMAATDLHQPAAEVIRSVIAVALHYYMARPEYRRITQYCRRFDFIQRTNADTQTALAALDNRFNQLSAVILQHGIDQGEFPAASITEMQFGTHACFDGAVDTVWIGCVQSGADMESYINAVANFIIAGLKGYGPVATQ